MVTLAALSTGKAILIGIASGVALAIAVIGAMASVRRPRRRAELDIPPGMKPGPSDPDLEKPILERLLGWGTILVVGMALGVGLVFFTEPATNKDDTKLMLAQSVLRGHLTTLPGTEENQLGFNCERCHGPGLHGGQNVFNGAVVAVPNLQTVCGGAAFNHPQIKSLDDVVNTIAQGRDGTDMPSWSVRYKGAMDDQQIEDVVNYLLSIQGAVGHVPADQNVCLHPAASPAPSASGSASPSASASASSSPSASPSPSSSP
jgi:Cytochrome C oxidase, cbb3-type, subunit III